MSRNVKQIKGANDLLVTNVTMVKKGEERLNIKTFLMNDPPRYSETFTNLMNK